MHDTDTRTDAVVVGGGLGGLVTGTLLARRGLHVTVLEAAGRLAGRAATTVRHGYHRNLGAHALYAGIARRTLGELGVPLPGGRPPLRGARVLLDGEVVPAAALLRRPVGSPGDVAALLGQLRPLLAVDPAARRHETIAEWLDGTVARPRARAVVRALARITTYQAADTVASADVALSQLRLALRGVRYLDGGWQPLAEALAGQVTALGGQVVPGARVERVVPHPAGGAEVSEASGRRRRADVVVLASGGPSAAARLLDGEAAATVAGWAGQARPIAATALDLSLRRPLRHSLLAGIDRPVFLSDQSRAARIAPPGTALVSVLRHHDGQPVTRATTAAHVAEIEQALDLFSPGWRELVVDRQLLPDLTVSWWLPTPSSGGLGGRPGPAIPGAPGVYVVGDWVGPHGYLLDAVVASARSVDAAVARGSQVPRKVVVPA